MPKSFTDYYTENSKKTVEAEPAEIILEQTVTAQDLQIELPVLQTESATVQIPNDIL